MLTYRQFLTVSSVEETLLNSPGKYRSVVCFSNISAYSTWLFYVWCINTVYVLLLHLCEIFPGLATQLETRVYIIASACFR